MRAIISLVLCFAMCVGMMPVTAVAVGTHDHGTVSPAETTVPQQTTQPSEAARPAVRRRNMAVE